MPGTRSSVGFPSFYMDRTKLTLIFTDKTHPGAPRRPPPVSPGERPHEGTLLAMVDGDPNQYFFYTDGFEFNYTNGSHKNKFILTRFLHDFL